LEGLAENDAFLRAVGQPTLETVHTQETSLENIFIRVTGRELT
jgi:fluoroquinolone transport system ATP-binding protein